jgi:GrpB-like predicted nucleotidyltransferase (UPF0157 family)
METFEEELKRVLAENIEITPYDPLWPEMFEIEKHHLRACLPSGLVKRIEHFGSTAIPGLAAKPVIDILAEVISLDETRERIAPVLEKQGYDYFWRPSFGDDIPPFYAWFIKRGPNGNRTHHIHMVEGDFEHWDRLFFRDYLIEHPGSAKQYQDLKMELSKKYPHDRTANTKEKSEFIVRITEMAKKYYRP